MKKVVPILFSTMAVALCHAQQPTDTLTLSRNEAVRLGLQNRYDIKAHAYTIKAADSRVRQARNNWLPQISGEGQVKYSPQLQNSVIPGGVLPGFNEPTLLPLTVKNQTVFGLNLSQPLYDVNLVNDGKIAQKQLEIQQEKKRAAEIDIAWEINRSYLDVTLRALQKRVAADIVLRNVEYERLAQSMLQNGSLIGNHYLRAKLDRENADQLLRQAEQSYALSLLQLHYQLNIPESVILKLTDSLNVTNAMNIDVNAEHPSSIRSDLRQLELTGEEYALNIKKSKQAVLPSLSLGASYAQQFLSDDFKFTESKWWSPFSYVALNLHIPISAHYKEKALGDEYRQRSLQNTLLMDQKRAAIHYETQQARIALVNAISNMKNATGSYELSRIIFHNQQEQYRIGTFDYSALLDTEKSLSITEQVYIQSAYDLMLAQLQLQKATNTINVNK